MKLRLRKRSAILVVAGAIVLAAAATAVPAGPRTGEASEGSSDEVKVLVLMSNLHGAYFSYLRDQMELYGWDLTFAGVTNSVTNCSWGVPFGVDTLVSEITDVSPYDCLLLGQSQAYRGLAYNQLLASPEALDLVRQAVQDSLLVVTVCAGTRVLAAADVIDGKQVTGYANYSQEYIDAGAIYLGDNLPPVLDGNILTCSKGHYYTQQIGEAMRAAVDSLRVVRGRQ
jgi:putative intracellular protease/amidase